VPKQTKYYYWQTLPYRPHYYVFLHWGDLQHKGAGSRIAEVRRFGYTWKAANQTDTERGEGKTRDAAVDDLLSQIGGLG
jgi:hypothetical protein